MHLVRLVRCSVFTFHHLQGIALACERNTCEKKSTWLERACTPSSNLECAIFLGVVRAIWLNAHQVTEDEDDDACEPSLNNADSSTPDLLQVVHSTVAVEIFHLEECTNIIYLPGSWPQQVIGLQVGNHLGVISCHRLFLLCTARRAYSRIDLCHP